MFKFEKSLLPDIFNTLYKRNVDVHTYFTRQRTKLNIPKTRLEIYKKTMKYVGVKVWNYCLDRIEFDCSFLTYKRRLKIYIVNNEIPAIFNL